MATTLTSFLLQLHCFRDTKTQMEIEFDPTKDQSNLRKHGVSLSLAEHFEMDVADIEEDTTAVGERRFRAIGPIGNQIHVLIFTYRTVIRAISLRLATRAERKRYLESFD